MKAKRVKKLDPERPLAENASRLVAVRLDELRSLAPEALDGSRVKPQHDMRIAAKRLRYVLELTGFCFGPAAERARRRAKDLQDILGEMHDCDVMLPRVERHLAFLRSSAAREVRQRAGNAKDLDPRLVRRAPNRTAYRGLEVLALYLEARRELLFDRFQEFWRAQEKAGTWTRLEHAAERQLELVRERRRAASEAERARREAEEAREREAAARSRAEQSARELEQARG
jgi:CHAD domain